MLIAELHQSYLLLDYPFGSNYLVVSFLVACKIRLMFHLAGPPKALDEDETEFLDKLEMVRVISLHIY